MSSDGVGGVWVVCGKWLWHCTLNREVKMYKFVVSKNKISENSRARGSCGGYACQNKGPNIENQMNPRDIKYCQDSIARRFRDGRLISSTMQGLRSGVIRPNDIPPIIAYMDNGLVFTSSNRRLWCFKQAGVTSIGVCIVPKSTILLWKMTTKNFGDGIRVR